MSSVDAMHHAFHIKEGQKTRNIAKNMDKKEGMKNASDTFYSHFRNNFIFR